MSSLAQARVRALPVATDLGEGPHWDDARNVLYYVDINGRRVHKYDPATERHTAVTIGDGTVSFAVPVHGEPDQLAVSVGRRVAVLRWDGESALPSSLTVVAEVDDAGEKRDNRFNDGKADPAGRLWAGTMGPEVEKLVFRPGAGSLFSVGAAGAAQARVAGVSCSNGLAWTRDATRMFYIDSPTRQVHAFDYDLSSGDIGNRRAVFDFKLHGVPGLPDGMAIDEDDKLWVACFDGGRVIHVDPVTGALLGSLKLPSPKITSVAFGGARLDELYVTSAATFMAQQERVCAPTAGCTYCVTGVGARGPPSHQVQL